MIRIQNIYYMLSYAFQILQGQGYRKLATEKYENMGELCTAILCKGFDLQLKRGLGREYVWKTETLSAVRGKIDLSESLKPQYLQKQQLVCSYDDFSTDFSFNQILRSTMELLLYADISNRWKKELKKRLVFLEGVQTINLRKVNWNIHFNRNQETYSMLIGICYLVVKGLLQTQKDGTVKLMDFLDEQHMCRLYEKFILGYYSKHYPALSVRASQVLWALDENEGGEEGSDELLPIMQTDIMLRQGVTVLIIDAKYYDQTMQTKFDRPKIHSNNLYQIFTYVKNCDYSYGIQPHTVSGMLLYAKTAEAFQPDGVYQMHGNRISVRTLDLNQDFSRIAEDLDRIVEEHFADCQKR